NREGSTARGRRPPPTRARQTPPCLRRVSCRRAPSTRRRPRPIFRRRSRRNIAFSSEVEAGSRKENASKQKTNARRARDLRGALVFRKRRGGIRRARRGSTAG